jgi:perosamine synthetase
MQQAMIRGVEVAAFESEFSALVDRRHCVAVTCEAAALRLSLSALGIGAGDEVIVPSFAPGEAAEAVQLAGAQVVFADIDPRTFCLSPEAVAAVLTPHTAAVIPVHLFGHPAAVDQLSYLAASHGITLIEHAARSSTAALSGRPVGTYGGLSVFTAGPISAVITGDGQLARTLRLLRDRDASGLTPGDGAAVGARQWVAGLSGSTARRRAKARFLDSALTGVVVPHVEPGAHHVYDSYNVRVPGNGRPDRDAFARALAARGVRASVTIPTPIHRLARHRSRTYLPHTEAVAGDTLSLPLDEWLTERELIRLADACNRLGGLL